MKLFVAKILLGVLSWLGFQQLGAFTTLNSTDQLSAFPTTYNNNLTATLQVGTTSVASITTLSNLVSIGTITTGVWNGTTIAVANGGTGSTTLSANQVLLGNGTTQLGVVNGFGTSGQFLTSNGAGLAPIWQSASVNQTQNYQWTGNHTFSQSLTETASTTLTNASTTAFAVTGSVLGLNGVNYRLPSGQGASTTALMNDGNGNLNWDGMDWQLLAATSTTYATSTINFNSVPNKTFYHIVASLTNGSSNNLMLYFNGDSTGANYGQRIFEDFSQTNSGNNNTILPESTSTPLFMDVSVSNLAAIHPVKISGTIGGTGSLVLRDFTTDLLWNNTAVINQITFQTNSGGTVNFNSGATVKIYGSTN